MLSSSLNIKRRMKIAFNRPPKQPLEVDPPVLVTSSATRKTVLHMIQGWRCWWGNEETMRRCWALLSILLAILGLRLTYSWSWVSNWAIGQSRKWGWRNVSIFGNTSRSEADIAGGVGPNNWALTGVTPPELSLKFVRFAFWIFKMTKCQWLLSALLPLQHIIWPPLIIGWLLGVNQLLTMIVIADQQRRK